MLTKGDVLVAMGKIKNVYGSAEKMYTDPIGPSGKRASEVGYALYHGLESITDKKSTSTTPPAPKKEAPLDARTLRQLIVKGMEKATVPSTPILHSKSLVQHLSRVEAKRPDSLPTSDPFDEVLSPYTSLLPPAQPNVTLPDVDLLVEMESRGIPSSGTLGRPKKDEWAGLY